MALKDEECKRGSTSFAPHSSQRVSGHDLSKPEA
jgi:hypothetical protein